jgi:hypothetical protein
MGFAEERAEAYMLVHGTVKLESWDHLNHFHICHKAVQQLW